MKTICGEVYWNGLKGDKPFGCVNMLRYWYRRTIYWKLRVELVEARMDQLEAEIKRLKTKAGE